MKYCPTCKRSYSDDKQKFCLDDGELLIEDSVEFRQATTQKIPNISQEPPETASEASGASHHQPNYAYDIVIGDGTVASAIDRFRKHLHTTTGIYKTMIEISGGRFRLYLTSPVGVPTVEQFAEDAGILNPSIKYLGPTP